jgi:hypothetical protein
LRVRGLRHDESCRQQCRRHATQCHRVSIHGCVVWAGSTTEPARQHVRQAERATSRFSGSAPDAIIQKNVTIAGLCNEIIPVRPTRPCTTQCRILSASSPSNPLPLSGMTSLSEIRLIDAVPHCNLPLRLIIHTFN